METWERFTYRVELPLGIGHLPEDALGTSNDQVVPRVAAQFGHEVLDELGMVRRDREESITSLSSLPTGFSRASNGQSSEASGELTSSSNAPDYGVVYFTPNDTILIVDGASPSNSS
jgi:hypothetical protein